MNTQYILVTAVVLVLVITAVYRLMPYRIASGKKPSFTLLPKYRKTIDTSLDFEQLDKELEQYGFKKSKSDGGTDYYTRGSLLGDFSVNLMKVRLGVSKPENGKAELTLEASWVVAFDTGDFWSFISELGRKLGNS
jgi:hypothetical protein